MKVTIITVALNNAEYIEACIQSVINQDYENIEYIVIDGGSTDGTKEKILEYRNYISYFVSEKDYGMYDALNKGINNASGDIVGFLHSDDVFFDSDVLSYISNCFADESIDALYGDVVFTKQNDINKIVRYYSSKKFDKKLFKYGYMPAHTSFFARKNVYDRFGYFKTDYSIAADFEQLLRFILIHSIETKYCERVFIKMRMGGKSNASLKNILTLNKEIMKACKENGIKTNYLNIYSKYFRKIFELR